MITKEVYEEQKALSDRWKEMYYEKKNQLDQLTNNWNELEEWLKEQLEYFKENNGQSGFSANVEDLEIILDKMKEIKNGDNND